MKKTLKMMVMLLSVATITTVFVGCDSKAKKEAEEAAKQEALMKEEAAKQEAEKKAKLEEYTKWFIDKEYELGYEAGHMSGVNKWKNDKEKEYDHDLSSHKAYYLRKSPFLKDYPSYESTCISKFKEGWEEGWKEGRKHQS